MTKSEMINRIAELEKHNRCMREYLIRIKLIETSEIPDGLTYSEKMAILLGRAIGYAHIGLAEDGLMK